MLNFSITNQSEKKMPCPSAVLFSLKKEILGDEFDLSLVFLKPVDAKKINMKTRQKNYIPNVLSFKLDKNSGEIFICLSQAEKEAPKFEMNYKKFVIYLFIHGALHLKNYRHGKKMETEENKLLNII